jgi:hypothetical protein
VALCNREYVHTVHAFYEAQDSIEKFKEDVVWLERDWSHHSGAAISFLPDIQLAPADMATQVAQLLRSSSLAREFVLKTGPHGSASVVSLTLRQLLGRLAGDQRINDAAMHSAMQAICRRFQGCVAIDPVAVRTRDAAIMLPDEPLIAHRCILVPVFRPAMAHWLLQVVMIEQKDGSKTSLTATVHMYDPLAMNGNYDDLQRVWVEYTRPMLQAWYQHNLSRLDNRHKAESDEDADGHHSNSHGNERLANVNAADALDTDTLTDKQDAGEQGANWRDTVARTCTLDASSHVSAASESRRGSDVPDMDMPASSRLTTDRQELDGMMTNVPTPAGRSTRRRRSLRMSKTEAAPGARASPGRPCVEGESPQTDLEAPEAPFPPFDRVKIAAPVAQPEQHDSVSCGIFCLAMAHSFADAKRQFEKLASTPPSDIEMIRLRLLWELTVNSKVVVHGRSDWVAVEEIGKKITCYFRDTPGVKTKALKKK